MNIDRIIFLNWIDIQIGRLMYINNQYVFQIVEENLDKAKEKFCPLEMLSFYHSTKGVMISQSLPSVFTNFNILDMRRDYCEKLSILSTDDDYTKLYKIASNSDIINNNGFWLSTNAI